MNNTNMFAKLPKNLLTYFIKNYLCTIDRVILKLVNKNFYDLIEVNMMEIEIMFLCLKYIKLPKFLYKVSSFDNVLTYIRCKHCDEWNRHIKSGNSVYIDVDSDDCTECNITVCDKCIVKCSCCNKTYSFKCTMICNKCHKQMCNICTYICEDNNKMCKICGLIKKNKRKNKCHIIKYVIFVLFIIFIFALIFLIK